MIFSLKQTQDKFIINAKTESDAERKGFMFEGNFRPISLVAESVDLEFDYVPRNVHPDHLALICFCAFYPYLTFSESVTFPRSISEAARQEFERFLTFTIKDKKPVDCPPIKVRNAAKDIEPYRPVRDKIIIAFGGGMDSTCLSLLFPEYPVVNQLDTYAQKPAILRLFEKLKTLNKDFTGYTHFTNIRSLNEPYGFSGWLCCYLLPLLIAADLQASGIVTGSVNRFLLQSGYKFNRGVLSWSNPFGTMKAGVHKTWSYLFEKLGILQYSPVSGITEMLTTYMVHKHGLSQECLYCQRVDGAPCHKCVKCFRKNLQLEFWEMVSTRTARPAAYWSQYDTPDIRANFAENYRTFGHLLNFLSQALPLDNKPKWFERNAHFCNANTGWVTKVYPRTIDLMPREHQALVRSRLEEHFTFMDEIDIMLCETFNCENYDFFDFKVSKQG